MKKTIQIQTPDPRAAKPEILADVQGLWAIHRQYVPAGAPTPPARSWGWVLTLATCGVSLATFDKLAEARAARKRAMAVPGCEKLAVERRDRHWHAIDPERCMPALHAAVRGR